jgi:exopolysaccharide biosynthesis protein
MKFLTIILIALCYFNLLAQVKIEEKIIADGVVYKRIINTQDTLIINILKIDFFGGEYILRSVKAKNKLNAKETTTKMAEMLTDSSYNVLAAINADFFENDGEVINNMVSEGNFVKAVKFTDSPYNGFVNSQFAVTFNNKLLIKQFVFNSNIILPDGSIEEIKRINSKADSNAFSLYNSYQGNYTPSVSDKWKVMEFVLKPIGNNLDTSIFVIDKIFKGGKTKITGNDFILSSNNNGAYYLERELSEADTIKLLLRFNPSYSGIRTLVGGWPRLVDNGENIIKTNKEVEGIFSEFSVTKHPRTGIGFSKDSSTVYFITVDGRQESSRGISLEQFAEVMISEGIYQGLNLDGGGSTTMVINSKVVNNPSDSTGEREVGNCLVLIRNKK